MNYTIVHYDYKGLSGAALYRIDVIAYVNPLCDERCAYTVGAAYYPFHVVQLPVAGRLNIWSVYSAHMTSYGGSQLFISAICNHLAHDRLP